MDSAVIAFGELYANSPRMHTFEVQSGLGTVYQSLWGWHCKLLLQQGGGTAHPSFRAVLAGVRVCTRRLIEFRLSLEP